MHIAGLQQPGTVHDDTGQRLAHPPGRGNEQVSPRILETGQSFESRCGQPGQYRPITSR
jgi:hypothetical protein